MFNHKLPTDFPMQTLRKKTSPCKYKNEPGRFLGEGVSFRAKLIGVLEVPEARGDRMCQEALADLKMAIRAAGEHKQRIQVHVAIDGLRLRDDKTGDSLYHHPVHKISFIAQDMTDSRAFGYIFGSPDTGHRFFGIKTDKAASQVVIAMRDLFQVVFELKKKEVEMAKQQLEGKTITSSLLRHTPSIVTDNKIKPQLPQNDASTSTPKNDAAEGGVAELVDLEQELSSLRRGLTQVEGLTPSADPFGDSFTVTQKGLLPPPPSGSAARGRVTPAASRTIFSPTKTLPFDLPVSTEFENTAPKSLVENFSEPVVPPSQPSASSLLDVFTELDPLGTGRSKPYVDKKLFFQELKNPPKKVLKDLVPNTQIEVKPIATEPQTDYAATTTMTSLSRHSGGTVAIAKTSNSMFNSNLFSSDPFAETDPFDNADPFSDSFKEDPFKSVAEFGKASLLREEFKKIPSLSVESKSESVESGKNVFNGPLQVSLPPEPTPKSPRLQRHNTDTSTIRQRPHGRLSADPASPPPPLPPKKPADTGRPPPPPPHEDAPPIPKPARKKEPMLDRTIKPRRTSATTNSSSDEYLAPVPPPLPNARRFDITLSQLLTLSMDELSVRLRVPVATLSSMTLPQLTDYLRSYLAADNDRPVRELTVSEKLKYLEEYFNSRTQSKPNSFQHIHVDSAKTERDKSISSISPVAVEKPVVTAPAVAEFKAQFEDDFAPEPGDFVADFDNFEKKVSASYDRYAVFREIQEQELKSKSILDPVESPNGDLEPHREEEKDEPSVVKELAKANKEAERKQESKSPLKSLDELTLDSFNMFRNSVSPKPTQIDAKIEDIKSVMKNLTIEKSRRSVSPREISDVNESKPEDANDRYAALREITITEPPDEFESLPPDVPKERKKSDEKSDGFDNSDFFDCIDNSSLSFTHVEDAFRKSPAVRERVEERKVEEVKEVVKEVLPVRDLQPPPRLSAGSISDVASASSPDTKDKQRPDGARKGDRWSMLGASPWSSDSRDSDLCRPRRRHSPKARPIVASSSSSREVSPWEEEAPPRHHHRDRERGSRHNSSGSRECLDSGSGREKDKKRDRRESRERDRDRDRDHSRSSREQLRDPIRDRKDSASRRDHKDYKDKRDRRSRERDKDIERTYSRDYRDSRSRERQKDYREKDRERHVKSRHSYDEDEDYSDGCPSGRSSPRDRWSDPRWRRDERNYGSLGWRESRRRNDNRPPEDPPDRRYTSTLNYGRRSARPERERRRRRRDHDDNNRHYSSLDPTRFSFDPEDSTASPPSAGPNSRSQWWWQSSESPHAFEDDFTSPAPRHRNTSIAEEEETDLPPLRPKKNTHKDIKKSESVNIFTRESDPFEGDAFFACTGSDKAAKRENWPGDFQGFDRA